MLQYEGLTKAVTEEIIKMIISGEIPFGTRVSEEALASQYKISRSPLREALQILEQQYFIQSVPRKGKYVIALSKAHLATLCQCREMIECYAIDDCKEKNIRDVQTAKITIKNAAAISFPSDKLDDKLTFLDTINKFHLNLVEETNNSILIHFYTNIMANIKRYIYLYMFKEKKPSVYFKDHEKIYEMIANGKYSDAKKAIIIHIRDSQKRINNLLDD